MTHRTSLFFVLLFAFACGDDDRAPRDGSMDGSDAAPDASTDLEHPFVVETTPDDGSVDVPRTEPLVVTFSEAIGTEGTVAVRIEGSVADVDVTLEEDTLTVSMAEGWPAASEVEVRLADDFLDAARNALDRPYVFRFTTADDDAPRVVETSPAEGADDVSTRTTAIRVRFSEPMDQAAGAIRLGSDDGAIIIPSSAAVWSTFEAVFPIPGLENATDYRAVLVGFQDRAGNPADTSLLGDDAIDFTTRPDDEGPQVVSSTPSEGQLDVLLETLGGRLQVVFDEPMDTSLASAPLRVDGVATEVDVEWTDDVTAEFLIAGVAQTEAMHSLDLRGFRDAVGNLLSPEPVVGDGRLDFVTGVDEFVPYVATSAPLEGATDVTFPLSSVRLAFSESMDTTMVEVPVTDPTGTTMVAGTWSAGGTVLTLPGSAFGIGLAHQVDVRGLVDLAGTPVSDAHPYLGDGILDFTIESPTGESCDKALRIVDADDVAAGVYRFEITNEQRTRNNGSGVCDPNGIADTDAVIHYVKTTPALDDPGGEGAALRVVTDNVSNRVNVDVLDGVCDPRDSAADAARQVCFTGHDSVDQLLDLPAGDYYIWVSTADGSAFDIDVEISEVDAIPAGESCRAPYDTTASFYTPPSAPGQPHVWDLPAGPNNSLDISRSNAPFQAISCAEEPFGDVVIAFEKESADSVLDIQVASSSFSVAAELIGGACTRDLGGTTLGCDESMGTAGDRFSANAPAGTNYLWLAGRSSSSFFPGADVSIRELPAPTAPGSSCANAIDISAAEVEGGTMAITPNHTERYFAPSCVPASSSCAEEPFGDVVIAFEKESADSVLDIQVASSSFSVAAELIGGACTRDLGGTTLGCDESMGTAGDRFSANAPAGTNYLWLAGRSSSSFFPGADVSIRELPAPTAPGSSCANAIDISAAEVEGGTMAITPNHTERYFAPSCVPASSNVTWYAFITGATLTRIRAQGDGAVGLVDATSGAETECRSDAGSTSVTRFAPVGTRVCIGVDSDASITGLTFTEVDYTGPGTTAPVSLEIDAPPPFTGSTYAGFSISGDYWMGVTPTTIWQNFGVAGMLFAPKTGGVPIQGRLDVDGSSLGYGGVAIGEAIFTAAFNGSPRVVRLVDSTGTWDPTFLDVGASYPETFRSLATDGTDLFVTVQETSSSATRDFPIYRVSTTTPGLPEVVGRIDTVYYMTGLAADDNYFWFGAQPGATATRALYRVARSALSPDSTTTPERILGFSGLNTISAPMKLLRAGGNYYLYVRDGIGQIHIIQDPDGAHTYLGVLYDTDSGDYAMDVDETGALYFFGTHLEPEGQWYRFAP